MHKKIRFDEREELIYGGDYNPDQWLNYPDILDKDIELMKKAHINTVTLGVFSWSAYEPKEGEYHLEWLNDVIDRLYENGIYTILATPSGGKPVWLDKKYEEVRRCDGYGVREHRKERQNFCPSSLVFREKIRKINQLLAQQVKDKKGVILWHISNEFEGECFCPLCAKRFQKFLAEKYHNNIDELNEQWWTGFWSKRFTDFEQIDPPYKNGEESLMGLNLDWHRFWTWNVADYMEHEINSVKEIIPEARFTTNMMMFFPTLDYRKFADKLDVISWDSYPQFHNDFETMFDTLQEAGFTHALMRSLKKQPFMLMESTPSKVNWRKYNKLKKPGVHELSCMQALANGSDTVQYFQIRAARGAYEMFHSAVINHDGSGDTRVFKEVEKVGEILKKIKGIKGSMPKPEVAIVVDWDTRWALWTAKAFNSEDKKYEKTVIAFYKQLQRFGIDVDIISQQDSFDEYKLVFTPMMFLLQNGTAEKIKDYVNKGGHIVATYITGYVNENQLALLGGFPGNGLMDVFGLECEDIDVLWPSQFNTANYKGSLIKAYDYCELLKCSNAKVLSSYNEDFYKDTACLTENDYGLGKAYYIAFRCDLKELDTFFMDLFDKADIVYRMPDDGLEYHKRYKEGMCYEFFLNETEKEKAIEVKGFDIINDENANGELMLPPYGYKIIRK